MGVETAVYLKRIHPTRSIKSSSGVIHQTAHRGWIGGIRNVDYLDAVIALSGNYHISAAVCLKPVHVIWTVQRSVGAVICQAGHRY